MLFFPALRSKGFLPSTPLSTWTRASLCPGPGRELAGIELKRNGVFQGGIQWVSADPLEESI
jgi:hypothetical protein